MIPFKIGMVLAEPIQQTETVYTCNAQSPSGIGIGTSTDLDMARHAAMVNCRNNSPVWQTCVLQGCTRSYR